MRGVSKDNSSSPVTRFMARMQQTTVRSYGKIILIISVICTVLYLGKFTNTYLQTDRADTYHVKILNVQESDSVSAGSSYSYLAMIDAGSSGCRAHVYRYGKLGTLDGPLYILPAHDSKKVSFFSNSTSVDSESKHSTAVDSESQHSIAQHSTAQHSS